METLLRASDVAQKLNISKPYAYLLLSQGKIPSIRIGRSVRVQPNDLDDYIESCKQTDPLGKSSSQVVDH